MWRTKKNRINKFYLANSTPFVKFIKTHNLYFLYDNKCIQNQTNVFDSIDYNNLDGYQQEVYNKYKNSRDAIIQFSEKEYEQIKDMLNGGNVIDFEIKELTAENLGL